MVFQGTRKAERSERSEIRKVCSKDPNQASAMVFPKDPTSRKVRTVRKVQRSFSKDPSLGSATVFRKTRVVERFERSERSAVVFGLTRARSRPWSFKGSEEPSGPNGPKFEKSVRKIRTMRRPWSFGESEQSKYPKGPKPMRHLAPLASNANSDQPATAHRPHHKHDTHVLLTPGPTSKTTKPHTLCARRNLRPTTRTTFPFPPSANPCLLLFLRPFPTTISLSLR